MQIEKLVCSNQNSLIFGTDFTHSTFDEEENASNSENSTEAAFVLAKREREEEQ